jgi:hypothetical protein
LTLLEHPAVTHAQEKAKNFSAAWLGVGAWAKRRGLLTTQRQRTNVGIRATSLMRSVGLSPKQRPSAYWGSTNLYPVEVLDRAWSEMQSKRKAA